MRCRSIALFTRACATLKAPHKDGETQEIGRLFALRRNVGPFRIEGWRSSLSNTPAASRRAPEPQLFGSAAPIPDPKQPVSDRQDAASGSWNRRRS